MTVLAAPALAATAADNPLLASWTGPHGGVPPFDKVKVEQFEPAFEAAMAEQLAEIDAITAQSAPPDFANTLAALERAGRTMQRVSSVYGVWGTTLSTPEFQAVERTMSPKLAAFRDKVAQNENSSTTISCAPAPGSTRRPRPGCRRSTSGSRRSTRSSARTSSPTRPITCSCSRARPTWRVFPTR
jgi:peptidyl-dipeptidase Dcp